VSYQEKKNENLRKYCREGKIKLVKKWIDDPNININWNFSAHLGAAILYDQIEIVKLILEHPKLDFKFHWPRPLIVTWEGMKFERDPVSISISRKKFEILDLLLGTGKIDLNQKKYLDLLMQMNDEEMNEYLKKVDGFTDYVLTQEPEYVKIISQAAADIFLF